MILQYFLFQVPVLHADPSLEETLSTLKSMKVRFNVQSTVHDVSAAKYNVSVFPISQFSRL
jgi:hypothetical protein